MKTEEKPLFAAIEAGGTKFVCAVGYGSEDYQEPVEIRTTTPAETLQEVRNYFATKEHQHGPIASFGLATFGPAGVNPEAADYGWITSTPKPHWAQTNLRGWIVEQFGAPCGFDTDVNGAALAEWNGGAGMGCDTVLYITVGTGIGGGFVMGGRCLHGLVHPEMGHIRVPIQPEDLFAGCCPWHGNCLEGLASGKAMHERWGQRAETLPVEHPAWQMEAGYLGAAVANFILTLSPQRVILGGGVFNQTHLLPMVRTEVKRCLNGYLSHPLAGEEIDLLVVAPTLKIPGLSGAFVLAAEAFKHHKDGTR